GDIQKLLVLQKIEDSQKLLVLQKIEDRQKLLFLQKIEDSQKQLINISQKTSEDNKLISSEEYLFASTSQRMLEMIEE
ncbi:hypothetical protein A2U01_0073047, partial [Trifolium medium]|nr:hypothetical protein [Trifolium medium]